VDYAISSAKGQTQTAHSGNLNPQQTLMIRMESEQYVSIGTGELGAFWSQ
jgi:hypothetical protein